MAEPEQKAVVIALGGASSCGKTTLARLVRDIFPNSFILHEDDFYKPEDQLPWKDGLLDWDCADALSIPDIVSSLSYIRSHGVFPVGCPSRPRIRNDFESKEDRNEVGKCPVPDDLIEELKAKVAQWTGSGLPGNHLLHGNRLCIFDGFLLYTPSMSAIQPYLDVKFFLRVSYEKAKVRREARSGYATIEGWWADPPGYVDKIVWPNYVRDHAWMFIDGDVEGRVKPVEVKKEGINVQDMDGKYRAGEEQADMGETLSWLVGEVIRGLEELWGNSGAKHE